MRTTRTATQPPRIPQGCDASFWQLKRPQVILTAVGVSRPGKIVRENAGIECGESFGCQFCRPLAEPRDEAYLVNNLNVSVTNPGNRTSSNLVFPRDGEGRGT
jgi:hypothetical protein